MKIQKEEYSLMVKKKCPPSKKGLNALKAFVSGGTICLFAQMLFYFCDALGFSQKQASAFVPCTLIVIASALTAFGVFDKIAFFAGAGTLVPITGFANSIVSPAMEFQSEGRILGTGANMFKIAGPVLVYGSTSAVIYGVIYYFFNF